MRSFAVGSRRSACAPVLASWRLLPPARTCSEAGCQKADLLKGLLLRVSSGCEEVSGAESCVGLW